MGWRQPPTYAVPQADGHQSKEARRGQAVVRWQHLVGDDGANALKSLLRRLEIFAPKAKVRRSSRLGSANLPNDLASFG
jgi:hypothetical protein